MKRIVLLFSIALLLFSGCATASKRPQNVNFTAHNTVQEPLFTLSVGEQDLQEAGYRQGDWVELVFDEFYLRALIAASAHTRYTTLVPSEGGMALYLPTAITEKQRGTLIYAIDRKPTSSVSLSGSFVFTF
jgi:hypothetical protein